MSLMAAATNDQSVMFYQLVRHVLRKIRQSFQLLNPVTPWGKSALGNCYALGESALSGYEINHKLKNLAEGVGFEPTKVSLAGFQDRCTRPLCEPSMDKLTRSANFAKISG